jgi:transcriptional regulator with XRE-family HTH domain
MYFTLLYYKTPVCEKKMVLTGYELKKLRKYKGYHQKEIAEKLGICQQRVSTLESTGKIVGEHHFQKLLLAMDISQKEWEQIKHLFLPPPSK